MMMLLIRILLTGALIMLSGASGDARLPYWGGGGSSMVPPVLGEEFVGPFPNWLSATTGKRVDGTGGTLCTGATGNGSTDDTAAIQSCFNALATGQILYFPAGSYKISDAATTATSIVDAVCTGSMTGSDQTLTISSCSSGTIHLNDTVSFSSVVLPEYVIDLQTCGSPPCAVKLYRGHESLSSSADNVTFYKADSFTVASTTGISVGNYVNGAGVVSPTGTNTGQSFAGVTVASIVGSTINLTNVNTRLLSSTPVSFGPGLFQKHFVGVVGADPAATSFKWFGSSSGIMLGITGVSGSQLIRINFDARNLAAIIIDQTSITGQSFFDTGNIYTDDIFQNGAIAFRCGAVAGCAETSVLRDQFLNNTIAGIVMGNQNALNMWVWYSQFTNNPQGITNQINGGSALGGSFSVYNSNFSGSTFADISTGGTNTRTLRNNYSIGSRRFLSAGGGGTGAIDNYTFQGNTILDPTDPTPITLIDAGPLVVIDNVIRSSGSGSVVNVSGDLFSIGNTFSRAGSSSTSCSVATGFETAGLRLHECDNTAGATITATAPALPGTPPNNSRQIYEVTPGSTNAQIQAAICNAATGFASCNCSVNASRSDHAVVHLQGADYTIGTATLCVPPNSNIQIIGDIAGDSGSGATDLVSGGSVDPVLKLNGPSQVTLRNLSISTFPTTAVGLEVNTADQSSGNPRIFMESTSVNNPNVLGLLVDQLDYTLVEAHNYRGISGSAGTNPTLIKVIGGPLTNAGTWHGGATNIFGALTAQDYIVADVSAGAHLLMSSIWYDAQAYNPAGHTFLKVTGPATGAVTLANSELHFEGTPEENFNNFLGIGALVNNLSSTTATITGTASSLALNTALGMASTAAPFYTNSTSTTTEFLNGFLIGPPAVPQTEVPASPSPGVDVTFLRNVLTQMRNTQPTTPTPLGAGVTDVKLYAVGGFAFHFKN